MGVWTMWWELGGRCVTEPHSRNSGVTALSLPGRGGGVQEKVASGGGFRVEGGWATRVHERKLFQKTSGEGGGGGGGGEWGGMIFP